MKIHHISVLGVSVSAINCSITLKIINKWIKYHERQYVCVAAVHLIMECQNDPQLLEGVNRAGLVTPDGMPLVWIGRLLGHQVSRVYGPTLMRKLCQLARVRGYRVFLVGGNIGQSIKLKNRLIQRYNNLQVVGTIDTPARPISKEVNEKLIVQINRSRPDIVFVGMGCPFQELWLIENRSRLKVPVLIGVGAAFDFLSGDKKQAPLWVQNIGFEWLFRLLNDPRRLWYRYTIMNAHFCLLLTKHFIVKILQQNRS